MPDKTVTTKIGPFNIDGKLFYAFPDGSSLTCECLGEPFVSKIIDLYGNAYEQGKIDGAWEVTQTALDRMRGKNVEN